MSRELVYRFCRCGCATGCDPHYEGFIMEARYCPEGGRLQGRAEELGAALSAMEATAKTRKAARRKKALCLRMIRAVRDLDSHRGANARGQPCRKAAGELDPPGASPAGGRRSAEEQIPAAPPPSYREAAGLSYKSTP